MEPFNAYVATRTRGQHIEPKPGDRLPLAGVDAIFVSSGASTLAAPMVGAGEPNSACEPSAPPPADPVENPRSTGIVVTFGKFRFLDLGDLSGQPLFDLVCPKSMVGPVDAYLVAHHGGADAASPATFAAFKPRIAILNNGPRKGGEGSMFDTLHKVQGLDDVWQLHRSEAAGERNFAADRIANLDESAAHWIKLSASEDGTFRVLNGRTGNWKTYPPR